MVTVFNLAVQCQWRLISLLPAELIQHSNTSGYVLVADTAKSLPLLVNMPGCHSGYTSSGALLILAAIRPGIMHLQADIGGLVLPLYNTDEPDAATLNKDGHITSDLGHSGPMSGDMRTETQLEDEQRGQMRSYLTHI